MNSFQKKIEDNAIIWLLSVSVTAFGLGFGAYHALQSIASGGGNNGQGPSLRIGTTDSDSSMLNMETRVSALTDSLRRVNTEQKLLFALVDSLVNHTSAESQTPFGSDRSTSTMPGHSNSINSLFSVSLDSVVVTYLDPDHPLDAQIQFKTNVKTFPVKDSIGEVRSPWTTIGPKGISERSVVKPNHLVEVKAKSPLVKAVIVEFTLGLWTNNETYTGNPTVSLYIEKSYGRWTLSNHDRRTPSSESIAYKNLEVRHPDYNRGTNRLRCTYSAFFTLYPL